jgi:MFS family permease
MYYGWVIVGISFVTLFLALGTRFSFGVFYLAVLRDYGWSRAATAATFSIAMAVHAIFSIVAGVLIDRFGPRVLFPVGATVMSLGLFATSRIHAIWHLYVSFGVVVAMGGSLLSFVPHMALIPRWFVKKRGLASGITVAGIGMGTMVMAPFIQGLIDAVHWKASCLILAGIIFLIIAPLTALYQRRSPDEVGQLPDGVMPETLTEVASRDAEARNQDHVVRASRNGTLRENLSTREFRWMMVLIFSYGFQMNMLIVHQATYVVDVGYSAMLAATLVGVVAALRSGSGIVWGFLSDRLGRETGYTVGSIVAACGVVYLLMVRDTGSAWLLYLFVITYGLGYGAMAPVYAAATGDLFGGTPLGGVFGVLDLGFGFGGAAGAYVAGYCYDVTGSYTFAFLCLVVALATCAVALWMAAPRRGHALNRKVSPLVQSE